MTDPTAKPSLSARFPHPPTGCRPRSLGRVAAALLATAGLALLPAAASGKATQESIFQDDSVVNSNAAGRAFDLAELKALGVDTIHFLVAWRDLAPNPSSKRKPSGFSGASPNDYPAANWHKYDDFVRAAKAAGFDLLATPNGPAPRWAQPRRARGSGLASYNPNAKMFGKFVEAVGKRFSGSFDPGDGDLPRIDRWSFWNEPNLLGWLQAPARGSVPGTPIAYRALYRAGASGLSRSGHGGDQILLGELAPIGASGTSPSRALPPGEFLRELFCLDARNKPFRGEAARARGCNGFKKLTATGFAHHPYMKTFARKKNTTAFSVPKNRNWMPVSATKRLTSLLDRAAANGRIPGNLPIYFTEFGVQSDPPDSISGVSLDKQAAYMNDAEYLAYKIARVQSWAQFALRDDPLFTQYPRSDARRYGGFQTGLRFFGGQNKPSYDAYRLPIHVKKTAGGVLVWGLVRPIDAGPHTVQIESGSGGGFNAVGGPVGTNSRGYFQTQLSGGGSRWRFAWADNDGHTFRSREAKATRK